MPCLLKKLLQKLKSSYHLTTNPPYPFITNPLQSGKMIFYLTTICSALCLCGSGKVVRWFCILAVFSKKTLCRDRACPVSKAPFTRFPVYIGRTGFDRFSESVTLSLLRGQYHRNKQKGKTSQLPSHTFKLLYKQGQLLKNTLLFGQILRI
jgi:hypothetical protein